MKILPASRKNLAGKSVKYFIILNFSKKKQIKVLIIILRVINEDLNAKSLMASLNA